MLTVLLFICLTLVVLYYVSKPVVPLAQPSEFYKQHRDATIKYLSSVYPTATSRWSRMSADELARFYNSLWFYYNCESSFDKTVRSDTSLCWQPLPGCGTTYPKLPYSPEGLIYSFDQWMQDWKPLVDSDGTLPVASITGSVPGQTYWNWYNGPAPVWMFQRAVFRYIYTPTQPSIKEGKYVPDLVPGPHYKTDVYWKFPIHWNQGIKDNGYIEITAASEPGLALSPPLLWFDGWTGSGVFLNVGRSFRARNKIDCLWRLCKLAKKRGFSAQMRQWFGSDNPDQIIFNLVTTKTNSDHCRVAPVKVKGNDAFEICTSGMWNQASLPNTDKGWNNVYKYWVPDTKSWCATTVSECILDMRFGRTYSADRLASIMTFDEPLFVMGQLLKFDTLQLVLSANGNGFWQYEILELRGYPDRVKQRDYTDILEVSGTTISYIPSFVETYMAGIEQVLSIRDPFDVDNDALASRCSTFQPWNASLFPMTVEDRRKIGKASWEYNLTCRGQLSAMFEKLSLFGGPNNQCVGGVGFSGKPMTSSESAPYG